MNSENFEIKNFKKNVSLIGQKREINLSNGEITVKKQKKKIFWKIFVFLFVIFVGFAAFKVYGLVSSIFVSKNSSFLKNVSSEILDTKISLFGEKEGQINLLLLGIGGEGHDGPYLTDTIILAQIRPESGRMVLTSIPRDLYVDMPGTTRKDKINFVFADSFAKDKDFLKAGNAAVKVVSKLSGLEIKYFAVVDFQGFVKAVDKIGGLQIDVKNSFTDTEFPDDLKVDTKNFLPALTFEKGLQHMSGERALQFARSRHAGGLENGDFARSQRQQQVIKAFKDKIFSLNLITDISKLNDLLSIFAKHFHTNLNPNEAFKLFKIFKDKNISDITSTGLGQEAGLLCDLRLEETNQLVLVLCDGKNDFEIIKFFQNSFQTGKIKEEDPVIWMYSSTGKQNELQKKMQSVGIAKIYTIPNITGKNISKTVVYMVNKKPATEEFFLKNFDAHLSSIPPKNLKIDPEKVDAIVLFED